MSETIKSDKNFDENTFRYCPKCPEKCKVRVLSWGNSTAYFQCDLCNHMWNEFYQDPDERFDQPLTGVTLQKIKDEAVRVCTHRHCEALCHYLLNQGNPQQMKAIEADLVQIYQKYVKEEHRVKKISYSVTLAGGH